MHSGILAVALVVLGMPTGCCLQIIDGEARRSSSGSTTGSTVHRPPDGGSCSIDGQSFANGAINTANPAQCCNAKTSPKAWLPLFSLSASVPLLAGGNDEVSADFDSDGRDDVAIADGAGNIEVFFSQSDGGWTSPVILSTALAGVPLRPVAGDLNRDGKPDIIVGAGAGSLFVFLNQGSRRFASALSFPSPGGCPVDPVRVGDYDDDGWPDVVVGLARAGIGCSAGQVGLFRNLGNGDGELASPSVLPAFGSRESADLRLGDFNGDGALDIAVADDVDTVAFFLNNGHAFGAPVFNTTLTPSPFEPYDLVAAAFLPGSDGLAVSSSNNDRVAFLGLSGQPLTAAGTNVAVASSFGFPTPISAELDVNVDGRPDALFSNGGGTNVLINQGNGAFLVATLQLAGPSGIQMVTVGDLNGDGAPDLAVIYDDNLWGAWLNNCPP